MRENANAVLIDIINWSEVRDGHVINHNDLLSTYLTHLPKWFIKIFDPEMSSELYADTLATSIWHKTGAGKWSNDIFDNLYPISHTANVLIKESHYELHAIASAYWHIVEFGEVIEDYKKESQRTSGTKYSKIIKEGIKKLKPLRKTIDSRKNVLKQEAATAILYRMLNNNHQLLERREEMNLVIIQIESHAAQFKKTEFELLTLLSQNTPTPLESCPEEEEKEEKL